QLSAGSRGARDPPFPVPRPRGATMIRRPRPRRARASRRAATTVASRARTGLAAAMGLALAASLAIVALSHGYPATRPQMGTGSIWLPSDATGELTLFDGSTLKAAGQVQLA